MFPSMRCVLVVLALLLNQGPALAQSAPRQSRLAGLRQQNALLQQQSALQNAVAQTNSLLQYAAPTSGQQGGTNGAALITFQLQQSALQNALQRTNALLQASFRQNSPLSETALRQLNALQSALQQTTALQYALPAQGGQLTPLQFQTLSQQQAGLLGLLTSQPAPLPRTTSRR
jgi:hypothetical protein